MGTENYTMEPGTIYIMDRDGITALEAPIQDVTYDIPLSADAEPSYDLEIRTPVVQEFMGLGYVVDGGLLQAISGQPHGYYIEYYADIQVQARRHRKKRIDKKWLKRYGYKTVRRKIRRRSGC